MQTHRDSIVMRIAEQIENVDCDVLYVPVGSGVTLSGILEGARMFQNNLRLLDYNLLVMIEEKVFTQY